MMMAASRESSVLCRTPPFLDVDENTRRELGEKGVPTLYPEQNKRTYGLGTTIWELP
jgi:hypothetical protein